MSENKPREFWIDESESGLPQAYDAKTWNWSNTKAIHVIEKSAFDKQAQEIERLREQLSNARGDEQRCNMYAADLKNERDAAKKYVAHWDRRLAAGVMLSNEEFSAIAAERISLQAKCEIYEKALKEVHEWHIGDNPASQALADAEKL